VHTRDKMEPVFIAMWVLTGLAVVVYITRVVIRIQSKKFGYVPMEDVCLI
jgi:hypothetical protein